MSLRPAKSVALVAGGLAALALVPAASQAASATLVMNKVESRPFATFGRAGNNANDRVILAGPTHGTINLSSLTVSATGGTAGVRLRAVQATDGSCKAGHSVTVIRELMSFAVPAGDTKSVAFPSPISVTPPSSLPICLLAHADTTYVPGSDAVLTVSGSGFLR